MKKCSRIKNNNSFSILKKTHFFVPHAESNLLKLNYFRDGRSSRILSRFGETKIFDHRAYTFTRTYFLADCQLPPLQFYRPTVPSLRFCHDHFILAYTFTITTTSMRKLTSHITMALLFGCTA